MTRTQLLYPHNGRPFGELESAADCVPRRRGALRREVFKTLKVRHTDRRPFVDLPNSKSSRWGGGVTADEMREMQHTAFLGPRSDKSARVDLALLMQKYAR